MTNPTTTEKVIELFKSDSRKRVVLWVILGLVALAGVLFLADRVTGWRDRRAIESKRTEVNTALANLAAAQSNLQRDKIVEAEHKQDVINKTERYMDAINATNAARGETNRALENLNSAVNANRNIGITAAELEKRLNEVSP